MPRKQRALESTAEADSQKQAWERRIGERRYAESRLANLARWFYIEGCSQREIVSEKLPRQRELEGGETRDLITDASSITRLLKEARDLGVVSFDVDESFARVGREDPGLSRTFRDTFDLSNAIVIDVDVRGDGDHLLDDYLHTVLANAAGQSLIGSIRSGQRIAVSGGRAVYQAARKISRHPPARKGVSIVPLSGRMWAHEWTNKTGATITRPCDPDDVAFVLWLSFEQEPGTSFDQIALPLFAESSTAAKSLMEQTSFRPNGEWATAPPDLGIVGVGAISPDSGHRLADLYRGNLPANLKRYLDKIGTVVMEVVDGAGKNELYCGDVGNRIFPCLPYPQELNPEKHGKALAEVAVKIAAINDRMVVVNWSHLCQIKSLLAISGGGFKRHQLFTILLANILAPEGQKPCPIVTDIVLDSDTALDLLGKVRMLQSPEYRNVRTWYSAALDTVFPGRSCRVSLAD